MNIWTGLVIAVCVAIARSELQSCNDTQLGGVDCEIEDADCNNGEYTCCKGEDGKCRKIASTYASNSAKRKLEDGFAEAKRTFQASNFGGQMTAMYSGNYLAQNTLLNQCARETFPFVCQRKRMFDYNFQCSINIPYCQRIPCSAGNAKLDYSIHDCMASPGCCFDQALYAHRLVYKDAVLPGVPVCHLAIRNKYFQKEAREYVKKYGGWNPLLTSCLIDSYKDYIYMNKRTCDGIKALEYFGFKPKMAGWKNITSHECLLIGGCWRDTIGCHYEPRITKLRIRSAQEIPLPKKWTPQQLFGQPKCLELDYTMPATSFLSNLHYCLASGCSLDPSISTSVIQYYMMNVSSHLPSHMANLFRHETRLGLVYVDNFNEQIKHYHQAPTQINSMNQYANNYRQSMGSQWPQFSVPQPHMPETGFRPIPTYENQILNQYTSQYQRNLDEDSSVRTWSWGENNHHNQLPRHPYNPTPQYHSGYGPLGGAIYGQSSSYRPYSQFYCPFRNPMIPRLPQLRGKFDGCCDRPLCYMNRETVAEQTSGAASYYRPWSSWGPCSVTCGEGVQSRRRVCIGVAKCVGKDTEEKKCSGYYHCPVGNWMRWESWTKCGKPCSSRVKRTRVRMCKQGYVCKGPNTQTDRCQC